MAEFVKLSITESFKERALKTDFSKLDKSYPNPMCNVNETSSFLPLYSLVCALFYYETGLLISFHNEFYGYYA